jgi:hypothetical protein
MNLRFEAEQARRAQGEAASELMDRIDQLHEALDKLHIAVRDGKHAAPFHRELGQLSDARDRYLVTSDTAEKLSFIVAASEDQA